MHELLSIYQDIKGRVGERKAIARNLREKGTEEEFFEELVFCLLTPQSKARQAEKAIFVLKDKGLLFEGRPEELADVLNIVRFKNHKSQYVVMARQTCCPNGCYGLKSILESLPDDQARREWLWKNIKGMGFKEASHFLRNVGYGEDLAILDRHVLRNMLAFGLIDKEIGNLTEKLYLELEKKLRGFAEDIGIPFFDLDYVLWYKEAKDIFK